jgi:hypothetical protein
MTLPRLHGRDITASFLAEDPPGVGSSLSPATPGTYTFGNCRFGLAVWGYQMDQFDIVSNLNVGWRIDFLTRQAPAGPPETEYVQMIRVGQDRGGSDQCGEDYGYWVYPRLKDTGLGALVDANPGSLWIVGNEVDRINQGDTCPQQYAEAYHEVYHYIKGRDTTAQVAVSGLVEVTPGRLQYLDIMWETYADKYGVPMPVDVWTMHAYALAETNDGDAHIALGTDAGLAIPQSFHCPDPYSMCHAEHDDMGLFVGQVLAMRQWMKGRGQQDRPLLITEYNLLKPYHYYGRCFVTSCPAGGLDGCFCDENKETFHPVRVADYLEATFDYLRTARDPELGYPADDYRLVQQWLWYRLATDEFDELGHASNLTDPDAGYALTVPGQRWRDYVTAIPPTINLLPVQVPTVAGSPLDGGGTASVTLSAVVKNSGNNAVHEPVAVTFYSDEDLTIAIGSVTFSNLGGCARPQTVVTTTWDGLALGPHPFWVKVDSAEAISESKETDNIMGGWVAIVLPRILLPLVHRRS